MPIDHYISPASLDEAISHLSQQGAVSLAGGTDLLVGIRLGNRSAKSVVDLKKIPELTAVQWENGKVSIGAAVSSDSCIRDVRLASAFPGFAEALGLIGSAQIQGRCSAGGNVCNASPAADSVPALIANGAVCNIKGPSGERSIRLENFLIGPNRNVLEHGELLVNLMLPVPMPNTADAYLRLTPRTEMDIAVAGVGVSLSLDSYGKCIAARVAIGAVAPTALLVPKAADALVETYLTSEDLRAAVEAVRNAASPISDKRASAEYRTHIVGVLLERAIQRSHERIISVGAS